MCCEGRELGSDQFSRCSEASVTPRIGTVTSVEAPKYRNLRTSAARWRFITPRLRLARSVGRRPDLTVAL
jgi:hypothetical protein